MRHWYDGCCKCSLRSTGPCIMKILPRWMMLIGGMLLIFGARAGEVQEKYQKTPDAPEGRLYSLTFEDVDSKCQLRSIKMKISSVIRSSDGSIAGFKGKDPTGTVDRSGEAVANPDKNGNSTVSFEPLNINSLSNASLQSTPAFFKVGNTLVLQFNVCGSGGFPSLQSLIWP